MFVSQKGQQVITYDTWLVQSLVHKSWSFFCFWLLLKVPLSLFLLLTFSEMTCCDVKRSLLLRIPAAPELTEVYVSFWF